jgi:hypothetical protein
VTGISMDYTAARFRYVAGRERLTPAQALTVHETIGPAVGHLWRLYERAFSTGLDVKDKHLGELIRAARDALHAYSLELHYQNCGHRVGRPPDQGGPANSA